MMEDMVVVSIYISTLEGMLYERCVVLLIFQIIQFTNYQCFWIIKYKLLKMRFFLLLMVLCVILHRFSRDLPQM